MSSVTVKVKCNKTLINEKLSLIKLAGGQPKKPVGNVPHFSPLIVIHLVNVGIFEDEIDDSEEKAVGD